MGVGGPDSRRSLKGVTTEDWQPGGKRLLSGRGVTEGGHSCPVRPCSPSILHPLLAQKRASETVSLPVADFGVPRLAKHNPLALVDEPSGREHVVGPCSPGALGSGPARDPSGYTEHTRVPSARVLRMQAACGQPQGLLGKRALGSTGCGVMGSLAHLPG